MFMILDSNRLKSLCVPKFDYSWEMSSMCVWVRITLCFSHGSDPNGDTVLLNASQGEHSFLFLSFFTGWPGREVAARLQQEHKERRDKLLHHTNCIKIWILAAWCGVLNKRLLWIRAPICSVLSLDPVDDSLGSEHRPRRSSGLILGAVMTLRVLWGGTFVWGVHEQNMSVIQQR